MRKRKTYSTDEKNTEEVRYWRRQNAAVVGQLVIAAISVAAVVIAGAVAWVTYKTAQSDARTSLQQAQDSQLSASIQALGADSGSERVAGMLLLTRNTEARFADASQTKEPTGEVYQDYETALQILSGYLSTQTQGYLVSQASSSFGRGYGTPAASDQDIDLHYAADEVRILLGSAMESSVARLHSHRQPEIDLSDDELYGQSWAYVNFAWIHAYMPQIDLRATNLEHSQWQRAYLWRAYLQCSDLSYAKFQGANLRGVDLRGALVQGTDFRGAQIRLRTPTTVYGTAQWSSIPPGLTVLPASKWDQLGCLHDSAYWDNAPKAQLTVKKAQPTVKKAQPAAKKVQPAVKRPSPA